MPMTPPLHRVNPERLRHVHGEALLRRDFSDQSAQDDQLRWWHNRALHNAYGVVIGLTVKITLLDGMRRAKVSPGLAIDVFGRELVLGERRFLDVPDDVDALLLVLSYDRAPGTCEPPPGGFCLDAPTADAGISLGWIPKAGFSPRDGVPLASSSEELAFSPPRTRPVARPRIGRGVTIAGELAWDPWIEDDIRLGAELVIDTSASGFTRTPCYFVDISSDIWNPQLPMLVLTSFTHITKMTKDHFTLRLLIPWLYAQTDRAIAALMTDEQPSVEHLVAVRASAIRVAQPRMREPDLRSAVRGVSRATNLAVSWIGIQRDIDEASFIGMSDGSEERDEFS